MTQVSPQPDCVFPSSSPKSVKEQLLEANREISGPYAETPSFHQARCFLRLTQYASEDRRWFFEDDGNAVKVLKPKGSQWHRVTDSACDCEGFKFRKTCWHRAAVVYCGGVESLRRLMERFP